MKNELFEEGEYKDYGPEALTPESWMKEINQKDGRMVYVHKISPLGVPFFNRCKLDTPIDQFDVDWENVPKNFNWTNLHLHGLEIEPHLFAPQGTSDPKAGYITITPGGDYLYHFQLPNDHPAGTFWYHPHRHNSVAIQAWGGLAGMLIVRGKYDDELKNYGVTTEIPFVVHDPHCEIVEYPEGDKPGIAKVGRFLDNQNSVTDYTFMVSGRYQPTYTVKRNEVVNIRHLTATVEILLASGSSAPGTSSTKATEGIEGDNYPFYMVASDGITFEKPVKKNMIVTAGGERHDLLLSFSEPGEYLVNSDHLSTIQFFGTGPRDQILARFVVTEEDAGEPSTPIEKMVFTPGIPKDGPRGDIQASEVMRRRHFVFDMDGDTCKFPFPQFRINDTTYATGEGRLRGEPGRCGRMGPGQSDRRRASVPRPRQRLSSEGNLFRAVPDPKLVGADTPIVQSRIDATKSINTPNEWRDTMIIPPKG